MKAADRRRQDRHAGARRLHQMYSWRDAGVLRSDPWRGKWDTEGGGVLVNQSPHQLDILLWLMGPAAEVSGYWANVNHPTVEVDDTAVATIRFRNGGLGSSSRACRRSRAFTRRSTSTARTGRRSASRRTAGRRSSPACPTIAEPPLNDLWTVPGEEHRSRRSRPRTGRGSPRSTRRRTTTRCRSRLPRAIREGRPPLVTGDDGRAVVELFTAIYQSSRERCPIQQTPGLHRRQARYDAGSCETWSAAREFYLLLCEFGHGSRCDNSATAGMRSTRSTTSSSNTTRSAPPPPALDARTRRCSRRRDARRGPLVRLRIEGRGADTPRGVPGARSYLKWALEYLDATLVREPSFACMGMHEWAMVYRDPEIRHAYVPLRLSREDTDAVVEGRSRCGVRTSTPIASFPPTAPRNRGNSRDGDGGPRPIRLRPRRHGPLPFAYKVVPYCPSEILGDAFELAILREVDMRASPYDLSAFGLCRCRYRNAGGAFRICRTAASVV